MPENSRQQQFSNAYAHEYRIIRSAGYSLGSKGHVGGWRSLSRSEARAMARRNARQDVRLAKMETVHAGK